jgi:uncharacterized integral membrane protein (TIGR00697 family)
MTLIKRLACIHILFLTISNVLVQYPFALLGFHTTWGAFSYPLIFITTDLTTRLLGAPAARRVIFLSMIPGLISSFILACLFNHDQNLIYTLPELPLRVAFACFCAYITGQLLDITVFQRVRSATSWWLAPALATSIGNILDTFIFFFLAFYHCHHPFLSQHWVEIACIDLGFKTLISIFAFIPLYGILLNLFTTRGFLVKQAS